MFRSSLKRTSLLRSALFRSPLVRTLADLFDKLKNLSQPMIVAYEGDNPLETGRYPQPTTVLNLNGVNQYETSGDADILDGATHIKVESWVYPRNTAAQKSIFSKWLTTGVTRGILVDIFGGNARLIYGVDSTSNLSIQTPIALNQWQKVTAVWDMVAGITSISVDDTTVTGSTNLPSFVNNSEPLLVGAKSDNNATGGYFDGHVGPVDVYVDGALVWSHPLNQTSGTVSLDRNDNANPGTLMNGASWVVDNTLPWQADVTNEEGYTLGTGSNGAAVGVIIPPSTIDPSKDCLGNDLQFSGSVYPVIPVPEGSAEVSLNGTIHYLSAPHLTGSETVTSHEGTSTPTVSAGRVDFTAGTAAELLLSDGTRYDFTETSGTTVFDTSVNGNHGTLVNGPTWVFTRDGYGTNLNQLRGFTFDGAVRIPALADGSGLDARDGLPLTNPPVLPYGHNDSENTENAYEISETGSPTAASTNLSNFSVVTFSDTRTDLQTTLPVDAVYRRDFSTVKKDRLIAFYDTLTGDDKELAEQYTEPPTFSYSPSLDFSDGRNSQYLPLI